VSGGPTSGGGEARELAHAAVRGAVAAQAMTGMRVLTTSLGLVREPPPQAIFRQRARGVLRLVPRHRRRAVIEVAHWGYGAGAGFAFRLLPEALRGQAWAGPAYGLAVWLGFEAGIAPALGLSQAKRPRPVERAALAVDHVLYGFVLSEMRRRPRGEAPR
jgi:hypothetical protein